MIADLRAGSEELIECDICVVGAGAAGIAIGTELARSQIRTVILEAGGERVEASTHALYDAQVSGLPYSGHRTGRARVFGGTTTLWGGQALPLTKLDFERRDWVEWSGWPISLETIQSYYSRAGRFLGLDAEDYSTGLAAALNSRLPSVATDLLEPFFAKWSAQPDMARVHGRSLREAERVRVLLHANVTKLHLDESERVTFVEARSLDGRRVRVAPRFVVLACGGLEVPRILLANREQRTTGIGNEHDLVGRFLQDHPGCVLGLVHARDSAAVQRAFGVYHRGGRRYTVRFALTAAAQARERTLAASGTLMFIPAPGSGFDAARTLYRALRDGRIGRDVLRAALRVGRDLPDVARAAAWYLRGRIYTPRPAIRLLGSFEQPPDPSSRVTLSTERDALGLPRLDIHWRLDDAIGRTVRVFAEAARSTLSASGVGEVMLEPWVVDRCADWRSKLADHYHHIGTARMSDSPRTGVTDMTGRVHSVKNLYIASSAVFPTGGHSNPTLTILALAMRLSDHLRAEIGSAGVSTGRQTGASRTEPTTP